MKNNLREIVTTLNKDGTTVVLAGMKLPPNYGREYTESFEAVFQRLAEEMGNSLDPFLARRGRRLSRIHAGGRRASNADGARKVATHVMKFLSRCWSRRRPSMHFSPPDGRSTRQARHYFVALARRAQRTVRVRVFD